VPKEFALFEPTQDDETIVLESGKDIESNDGNGDEQASNFDAASYAAKKRLAQIQGWTAQQRNTVFASLGSLMAIFVSSHRYYPLCCAKADLLFAGDHFIDDTVSYSICFYFCFFFWSSKYF